MKNQTMSTKDSQNPNDLGTYRIFQNGFNPVPSGMISAKGIKTHRRNFNCSISHCWFLPDHLELLANLDTGLVSIYYANQYLHQKL